MSLRPTMPSLAMSATAALLFTAVTTVTGQAASAATTEPPAGSTIALPALTGTATPGRALSGSLTVTAPDDSVDRDPATPGVQGDSDTARDLVAGQDVTLSVDHGFFTTGAEEQPSVVGAPAGNLAVAGAGTTLTGTTDSNGVLTYQLAMERDAGFDDDGRVTAVVTAQAGTVSQQRSAVWSSASPLNGGSVEIVLSPQAQQETPVAPAVAGDRTYYDVVTRDQFGNPVAGEAVDLDYDSNERNFDYSEDFVESDLGREGDFWVVSLVPADVAVTGTWDAPSYRYTNVTGGVGPAGPSDVSGSATASFYGVSFAGSAYTMSSSSVGDAAVGSTVTQTVTVLDQRGNPVRGLEVRFFRFGPDSTSSDEKANKVTNALGQASYSFVGVGPGIARVTAVVTDGVAQRTLAGEVRFRIPIGVSVSAAKGEPEAADVLKVSAGKAAAKAKVVVYRVVRGKLKAVGPRGNKLNEFGRITIEVPDRNGRAKTRYVVIVRPTSTTFGATSAELKVR